MAGSSAASPVVACSNDADALRRLGWRSQEIHSITLQGNRAAVHFKLVAVFTPTGAEVRTELLDLVTVVDDKVTDLVEFVDTAHVAQVVAAPGNSR